MKKLITVGVILLSPYIGQAQKIMMLPRDFQSVKPMVAIAKGIATVPKYKFGPYGIVSGKAGWITSEKTGTGGFFKPYEQEISSKQRLSFLFVAHKTDSVLVNAAITNHVKTTDQFIVTAIEKSKQNFIAELAVSDTVRWNLIMTTEAGLEVKGNYQVMGSATNGATKILIQPVHLWADGSRPMMDIIIGYVFYVDEKPIAAVQSSSNTFHKKLVWIHEDLSPDIKLAAAAISSALLIMVETQTAAEDSSD